MKNFSQFVSESSRVEWIPNPKIKSEGGKVNKEDIPEIIKTDGPKKEKPEGRKECQTCEGTGKTKNFTGRVGQDKEGTVQAQYLNQGCKTCKGSGHVDPNPPPRKNSMIAFFDDPDFRGRGND